MTYYLLQMVGGGGSGGAAFDSHGDAKTVLDIFNARYASEYELVETDEVSAGDITRADVIRGFEL